MLLSMGIWIFYSAIDCRLRRVWFLWCNRHWRGIFVLNSFHTMHVYMTSGCCHLLSVLFTNLLTRPNSSPSRAILVRLICVIHTWLLYTKFFHSPLFILDISFTRVQFWSLGIIVACVCLMCVNPELVCEITHHPVKLESPNLDKDA